MTTLYEVLKVKQNATTEQIRISYRALVKVAHPDAGGSTQHFLAIQSAYEVLSDPLKRSIYDQQLHWTKQHQANPFKQQEANYRFRKRQAEEKRKTFDVTLTTLHQRTLFGDEVCYIEAKSLIATLRRAEKYYQNNNSSEVLKVLTDAIQRMTQK